jgi:hypothetical protein
MGDPFAYSSSLNEADTVTLDSNGSPIEELPVIFPLTITNEKQLMALMEKLRAQQMANEADDETKETEIIETPTEIETISAKIQKWRSEPNLAK